MPSYQPESCNIVDGRASNYFMRCSRVGISIIAISVAFGSTPGFSQPEPQPVPHAPVGAREPTIHDSIGSDVFVYLVGAEQPIRGRLVGTTETLFILEIGAITQSYDLERIDRFETIPDIETRYRTMRSIIVNNDIEQILALCSWVLREGREDLAIPDLRAAAELKPDDSRIADMLRGAEARARLRESAGSGKPNQTAPADPAHNHQQIERPAFAVLTADQINLIKVFEIDFASNPRIEIDRDVIDRLLTTYETEPGMPTTEEGKELIRRQPAKQQLDLMFRLKARELYPFVKVRDHPPQILAFRDRVHRTWLVNSCASSACHGGEAGGRFRLKNTEPNVEATYYTNLLIIDRFKMSDGRPLINYAKPEESPILHLAMDRAKSLSAHPQVPGIAGEGDAWRPFFRNTDDRRYQQALQWIQGMYMPRPDYGIDYTPPTPSEPSPMPGDNAGGR